MIKRRAGAFFAIAAFMVLACSTGAPTTAPSSGGE